MGKLLPESGGGGVVAGSGLCDFFAARVAREVRERFRMVFAFGIGFVVNQSPVIEKQDLTRFSNCGWLDQLP